MDALAFRRAKRAGKYQGLTCPESLWKQNFLVYSDARCALDKGGTHAGSRKRFGAVPLTTLKSTCADNKYNKK